VGDRTYLKLTIHGHIPSLDAYNEIIAALAEENLESCMGGSHGSEFLRAILDQDNPVFEHQECNYADISSVEAVLQMHKVAYYIAHGDGAEYGAQCKSWTPEGDMYEEDTDSSGDPTIGLSELIRARDNAAKEGYTFEAWVLARVDAMEKASGKGLPSFTMADEASAQFAKRIAKAALGLKAA
jgi:hypothetical protein